MGYRLEISEITYKACGGKLYGYLDDEEKKLPSYQWLLEKGYLTGNETWYYGFNPRIILTSEEFKEFIELYILDKMNESEYTMIEDSVKDLIETKCDKLLEWF